MGHGALWRLGLALALAATLLSLQGCTFVRKAWVYSNDRVRDGLDMVDLGMTVSVKPSLSAYACLLGLGGLGGGTVNGYFVGIGGSRIGIFRHYHSNIGVGLYAYEVNGWGDFDVRDRDTLARRSRGPIAWLFFPGSTRCKGNA